MLRAPWGDRANKGSARVAMNAIRSNYRAALLALLLSASFACNASHATVALLLFNSFAEKVHASQLEVISHLTDPLQIKLTKGTMAQFDEEELRSRAAAILDQKLNKDDIDQFASFVHSPTGVRVAEIYAHANTADEVSKAIKQLPRDDLPKMNAFYSSQAGKDIMAAMNSAEMKQLVISYTEELECRYAVQHRDILKALKKAGKCEKQA